MTDIKEILSAFPMRFLSTTHQLGRSWRRDILKTTPEQIRFTLDGMARLYPGSAKVSFEMKDIAGVPTALLKPNASKELPHDAVPDILLVHGGGFSFGSARTHRALGTALARLTQCNIWIPEYRLAPEHPFPTSNKDLAAVYMTLRQDRKLFVLGDSAGGNLATVLVQTAKKEGWPDVNGLILLSPWLDLRPQSESNVNEKSEFSPFERLDMLEYAEHYLQGSDANQPSVSPILGSFDNFPPVYLETSRIEYLYPDALELAKMLRERQSPLVYREEQRALHGWQLFPDVLPEAKKSVQEIANFIHEYS